MQSLPNYESLQAWNAIRLYGNMVSTVVVFMLALSLGKRALGAYSCCKRFVQEAASNTADTSKDQKQSAGRVVDTDAVLGLRFIAAMNVMVGHFLMMFSRGDAMAGWAVSVFFIVSGYVMTIANLHRCQDHNFDAFFIAKRVARLLPMNWMSLLLTIPALVQQGVLVERLPALPLNIVMIQNWGLCEYMPWNPAGWTLSAFLFFYIAFGPLARMLKSRQDSEKLSWTSLLLPGFLSLALPTVVYVIVHELIHTQGWPFPLQDLANLGLYMVARSNPLLRLPTFYLGMVFGALALGSNCGERVGDSIDLETGACENNEIQTAKYTLKAGFADILSVTVVCCWCLALWVTLPSGPLGLWGAQNGFGIRFCFEVGLIPLFAVWIFALTDATQSYSYKLLTTQLFKYGGNLSFSIYLLHIPVMSLGAWLLPPPWPAWMLIPCVPATLLTAAVCYHGVEKPLREPLSRWLAPAVVNDSHN